MTPTQKEKIRKILNNSIIEGIEEWRSNDIYPVLVGNISHEALTAIEQVLKVDEGTNKKEV